MRGKVTLYDKNTNKGVISSEDGVDYNFNIKDVINSSLLFVGDLCDFKPVKENNKFIAKKIISDNKLHKFLKIQNTRILLKDIVDYGIRTVEVEEPIEPNLEDSVKEFFSKEVDDNYDLSIYFESIGLRGIKDKIKSLLEEVKVDKVKESYLFIVIEKYGIESCLEFRDDLEELKRIEKRLDSYFGVIE